MAKSQMARGALRFAEFATELNKEVSILGGNEEMVFEAMKNDSGLAKEMAGRVVSYATKAKNFALKHLRLIAENIPVATQSFTKQSFFMNGPAKFWFGENFKNWILPAIPESIPAFETRLVQAQLMEFMKDSGIRNELGNPEPFTVTEFAAVVKCFIER